MLFAPFFKSRMTFIAFGHLENMICKTKFRYYFRKESIKSVVLDLKSHFYS